MYLFSALQGQGTSACPRLQRGADGVDAGNELAVVARAPRGRPLPMRVMIRMLTAT